MSNAPGPIVDFLVEKRFALLGGALVLLLVGWPVARQLKFDRSIESLYADDDPHIRDYLESKRLFGGDEFVIVAWPEPELLQRAGDGEILGLSPRAARRIEQFAQKLNGVPGVRAEHTQHLAKSLRFRFGQNRVLRLTEKILVGEDRKTTAIVLRLKSESRASVSRGETFRRIRQLARNHQPRAYVVGEPLQVHDMFRYVEEDGRVLFRVSLVLLGGVLFVLFGRPGLAELRAESRRGLWPVVRLVLRYQQWVVLPLLVVLAAIVWTEALLVLSRVKLSMVSSMLNAIVTIIAVATVTHVTVHFREHRTALARRPALKATFSELLPAVFWTCATTAAGFAALLSSSITPVQSFGRMMGLASLLVFAGAVTLLPGGILLGRWGTDPRHAPAEGRLVNRLRRLADSIERHPRLLGVGGLVLTVVTGLGLFRLDVETDFSKNFRKSSPIIQGLIFVETRLGGAGTWEVNFPAPRHQLNEQYLEKVERLAEKLRAIGAENPDAPRPTKVVAITDGLELVPPIPFVLNTIQERLDLLNRFQPDYESTLYNRQKGRMRIVLRARERQSSEEKLSLIREVERVARKEFPEAKATGLFVLLTFLIESLLRDQLVSFAWASCGILVMMTIAFRSLRIGLISLVPNFFPIVLVVGTMGWTGLPVNIATAMIASVSMGLTVDSTIHYIAAYRRGLSGGMSIVEAMRETHAGVGRAMVFATVALIVGFTTLSLSHFIPLVYFGLLLSVAMLGGLFADLLLLPLLLKWTQPRRPSIEASEARPAYVEHPAE